MPSDGGFREPTARHERFDDFKHFFYVEQVAEGVPGRYGAIMQLPQETGGDTHEFEFDVPSS